MGVRILVTGSRSWGDPRTVWNELAAIGIEVYNRPGEERECELLRRMSETIGSWPWS